MKHHRTIALKHIIAVLFTLFFSNIAADGRTIVAATSDRAIESNGDLRPARETSYRIGGYNSTADTVAVVPFQLPALLPGETILDASATFTLQQIRAGTEFNVDLYALGYRTTGDVLADDYYCGIYGGDSAATALQQGFSTPATPLGPVASDASAALVGFLNAQYAAGAQTGDYIFLRLCHDVDDAVGYDYYTYSSAEGDAPPLLTITTSADLTAPSADAGPDRAYTTDMQSNPVAVTLDASASTPADSAIATWTWSEDAVEIASGEIADVDFPVGVHEVTLTVTDAEGDTDADTLTITILDGAPTPPVADAGSDQSYPDNDGDGQEQVTLNGSASHVTFAGASIASWQWSDAGGDPVGNGATIQFMLPQGDYTFTLTVTDSNGLSDSDSAHVTVGREQLHNLPSDRPAFPVPFDIVWPEAVGEPHICLWYGDKVAALSITIDDNYPSQTSWWMDLAARRNIKLTWFLIVEDIYINPPKGGTWPLWNQVFAAGHSVQSHTYHAYGDCDERTEAELRYEYGESILELEANIPGNQCLALAYPRGLGDPELAREYFIAARGTVGTPNQAGTIDWMKTRSVSGKLTPDFLDAVLFGTSPNPNYDDPKWKRGWLCEHFHNIDDPDLEESRWQYVDTYRDLLWIATFVDVAKFGQQRDSAELTVVENSPNRIAFDLSDRMKDAIFDHPLTIKVRIPDAWAAQAAATQNGDTVDSRIVQHGEASYILLDAIPDRGTVEILHQVTTLAGDADANGKVDIADFIILKRNYNRAGATWSTGDFNGDGIVDISDFILLKKNYGTSVGD